MIKAKYLLSGMILALGTAVHGDACTGISLTAKDGSYVQARTIEWSSGELYSEYVIIPRGQLLESYTPEGKNGLKFKARYGTVGLSVVEKEFIAEGTNETGLSAGLFYFPGYGSHKSYQASHADMTLADLQVVQWILTQFSTIDEVKEALGKVHIVSITPSEMNTTLHWRISEPNGRQVVLEIEEGIPHLYENEVGVLTNAPSFPWHVTNLNNYVNLLPGDAPDQKLGNVNLHYFGSNSGFLGLPGDFTPPSRFVRAAFFRATAAPQATAFETVTLCFHLLNNFDVPVGAEHPNGEIPQIPSATQWTCATDLTHHKIYYKTLYNNHIRCIDLEKIDFSKVAYQSHPLDESKIQPVEMIPISQ